METSEIPDEAVTEVDLINKLFLLYELHHLGIVDPSNPESVDGCTKRRHRLLRALLGKRRVEKHWEALATYGFRKLETYNEDQFDKLYDAGFVSKDEEGRPVTLTQEGRYVAEYWYNKAKRARRRKGCL